LALVSLDLDGTLIQPAIFNVVADALGFGAPLRESLRAYIEGRMSLAEAFDHDYRFLVGRPVADFARILDASDAWTPGIASAVSRLEVHGLEVVLTTDQPRFLAESTRRFGIRRHVCSEAEVVEGRVGPRVDHLGDKWAGLSTFLAKTQIDPRRVVHVGNGPNDVRVFENVGWAVAVNPERPAVGEAADVVIPNLTDLNLVADAILGPAR
jgi:phosphoserine phosphatase